jgi:hypothetical protein
VTTTIHSELIKEEFLSLKLDEIDFEIIRELAGNPRKSFSELGEVIGRSRATVRERVRRMADSGVIEFAVAVRKRFLESFIIANLKFICSEPDAGLNFEGCPRIMTAVGPDAEGIFTVMLLGESKESLKVCVQHFKERNTLSWDSFSLMFAPLHTPHHILLRETPLMRNENAGCQEKCKKCEHAHDRSCFGCPFVSNTKFSLL